MARIILEIPDEKLKLFLQTIVNLGLENHVINSKINQRQSLKKRINYPSQLLLTGWEFFSNELEYE
ncbi:MAG: hypothetical protein QM541_09175 [Flavobacterium sp.]|nr:hypothetical protein [Flavobacterium sp.]